MTLHRHLVRLNLEIAVATSLVHHFLTKPIWKCAKEACYSRYRGDSLLVFRFPALDAIQLKIYYDEEEEVGFEIGYEAVEKSHFAAEDSYSAQEKATLQGLIADALPLLDEAAYKFSQAVNDALLTFEDHKSFYDPLTAEYYRLKEIERFVQVLQVLVVFS